MIVVSAVGAPAAVASYSHARAVVASTGDEAMAPWLPPSVDGMRVAALVVIWVRRRRGQPAGVGPWAAFLFGMVVTISANLAAVERPSLTAYAVALFPPVALGVTLELVALVAHRSGTRADTEGTEELLELPTGGPGSVGTGVGTDPDRAGAGSAAGQSLVVAGQGSTEHLPDEGALPAGTPDPAPGSNQVQPGPTVDDRAAALIADGAGRRRLARELGMTEYQARGLLGHTRNGSGAP